jgi:hypothetical protein
VKNYAFELKRATSRYAAKKIVDEKVKVVRALDV